LMRVKLPLLTQCSIHADSKRRIGVMTRGTANRMAIVGVGWTLLALSVSNAQVSGQDLTPSQFVGQAGMLSLGGRLYDNHWVVIKRSQPNGVPFPEMKDAASWRCVSCHGWDSSGSSGPRNERDPGVVPLRGAMGRDSDGISAFLKSGSHKRIVEPLSSKDLKTLATFVCCGQHDIAEFVDADGKARGDALRGKDIYDNSCNRCHQADGKAPIFGEFGDVPSLGWIARERPSQAVHKITNGVPGADMLSLRFLETARIADLLAYLQTLDPP
jgi:mono/diheme cytochrome c family protein